MFLPLPPPLLFPPPLLPPLLLPELLLVLDVVDPELVLELLVPELVEVVDPPLEEVVPELVLVVPPLELALVVLEVLPPLDPLPLELELLVLPADAPLLIATCCRCISLLIAEPSDVTAQAIPPPKTASSNAYSTADAPRTSVKNFSSPRIL